ncbi:MAG: hypothetical protein JJT77_12905 [Crocinitomicaceae bacterium]|nr:hypothetical protein [Crocinitomicaceae bacterium]
MKLNIIKPKQALNKAFLKVKPVRKEIDQLVYALCGLTEEEIEIVENSKKEY